MLLKVHDSCEQQGGADQMAQTLSLSPSPLYVVSTCVHKGHIAWQPLKLME